MGGRRTCPLGRERARAGRTGPSLRHVLNICLEAEGVDQGDGLNVGLATATTTAGAYGATQLIVLAEDLPLVTAEDGRGLVEARGLAIAPDRTTRDQGVVPSIAQSFGIPLQLWRPELRAAYGGGRASRSGRRGAPLHHPGSAAQCVGHRRSNRAPRSRRSGRQRPYRHLEWDAPGSANGRPNPIFTRVPSLDSFYGAAFGDHQSQNDLLMVTP